MRELESILSRVARRRLTAAMLRAAIIGVAAAAAACAVLEVQWWGLSVGIYMRTRALFLLAAWFIGAALFFRNAKGKIRLRIVPTPVHWPIQLFCIISVLVLVSGYLLVPEWQQVKPWGLLAVFIPASAIVGVACQLMGEIVISIRGRRLLNSARFLDSHFHLKERATTAVELISSGQAEGPWGQCVCREALVAVEKARPLDEPMRWPTRLMGFAGLLVLLCVALLFLPGAPAPAADDTAGRVADALTDLTSQQKRQLADLLRQAAQRSAEKPAVEANLQKAAEAAERDDAEAMHKALELLASGGIELRRVIPKELVTPPSQTQPDNGSHVAPVDNATRPSPSADVRPTDYVRVMNPAYSGVETGGDASAKASAVLPWQDAWQLARARALSELSVGQVPAARRQLVKDFFGESNDKR